MRWATGLASFQRENLVKAFDSGLVKHRCTQHGISITDDPKERITSEEVTVISPETLLDQYQLSHVDLLQIDTEGFGYEVTRMFDLAKTQPRAIIFENIHLSETDYSACIELLSENGYRFKEYRSNTLVLRGDIMDFEAYV